MKIEQKKPDNLESLEYNCPLYYCRSRGVFWLPLGNRYFGTPSRPICFECTPPPLGNPYLLITISDGEITGREVNTAKRGRPSLNIPADIIYDTLRDSLDIKLAAAELKCSRPYIYKILGADRVKAALDGNG